MPDRPRATVSTVGAITDRRLVRLGRLGLGAFACLSTEASRSFVAESPAFGPIVDAIGARGVMLLGAVAALGLAWWCDVSRRAVSTLDDEAAAEGDQVAGHTLEARSAAGLDEHGVAAGE
jgi:hypothetical protein